MNTHIITLPFGFIVPSADPARRVVFGKRLTGADQIKVEDGAQSVFDIQKSLMYARASIIEFGDKKRAPYMTELLTLNRADRSILVEGYVEFLAASMGERSQEKIDDDTLKLAFGLVENGETYDLVTLCDNSSNMSGYDELEIERSVKGDYEHVCVLLGLDVAKLSQSDGERVIEGSLSLAQIKRLDSFDIGFMQSAANERRLLFRSQRTAIQENGRAGSGTPGS